MSKLELGILGETNCVFVALTCMEIQPYINYDQPLSCGKDIKIPRVLLILRWDGLVGFPGGYVDGTETLIEAACRETMEEIGMEVDPNRLTLLCSHGDDEYTRVSHLFRVDLPPDEFKVVVAGAGKAHHAEAEVAGILTPNLVHLRRDRGIDSIRRLPWAPGAGTDFDYLLDIMGIRNE